MLTQTAMSGALWYSGSQSEFPLFRPLTRRPTADASPPCSPIPNQLNLAPAVEPSATHVS